MRRQPAYRFLALRKDGVITPGIAQKVGRKSTVSTTPRKDGDHHFSVGVDGGQHPGNQIAERYALEARYPVRVRPPSNNKPPPYHERGGFCWWVSGSRCDQKGISSSMSLNPPAAGAAARGAGAGAGRGAGAGAGALASWRPPASLIALTLPTSLTPSPRWPW